MRARAVSCADIPVGAGMGASAVAAFLWRLGASRGEHSEETRAGNVHRLDE